MPVGISMEFRWKTFIRTAKVAAYSIWWTWLFSIFWPAIWIDITMKRSSMYSILSNEPLYSLHFQCRFRHKNCSFVISIFYFFLLNCAHFFLFKCLVLLYCTHFPCIRNPCSRVYTGPSNATEFSGTTHSRYTVITVVALASHSTMN